MQMAVSSISGIPAILLFPNAAICEAVKPEATLWKATAVGVLSKKEDNAPLV